MRAVGRWVGRAAWMLGAMAVAGSVRAEDAPSEAGATRFEGAIGLIVKRSAAFPGSSDTSVGVSPAGFLRYGRFTVTGAGGFTTRRADDVERGLGAELVRRDDLRLTLALRYDNGRKESDSDDLAGMGDIRATVRARLTARWEPVPGWKLTGGIGVDALNRVGGYLVEGSVAREWHTGPGQTWTLSAGLSGAGDRYLQAWHGVTQEQSVASGYPVFTAKEGLRDAHVSAIWRTEFAPNWAGFVGAGYTRLLGSAADSPLSKQPGGGSVNGAIVWRF